MSKISSYEWQYMRILSDIYEEGYSDGVNERTGYATKRLPGRVLRVDLAREFPILKSKFVAAKTALREILWIYQAQSNNIHDLKAHIWDSWADENGSIGTAYGAQIRKPVNIYTDPVHKTSESFRSYENQTKYVLEYLREFPNGRWANVTLWSVNDLYAMNLVPCCHTATWNLDGGRLNCVLDQRSGDMPYGVPFNTTQYAELTILFARDLGVEPGILTHVIADAHIYANQMEGVKEQLAMYYALRSIELFCMLPENASSAIKGAVELHNTRESNKEHQLTEKELTDMAMAALNCTPEFVIDSDITDFFAIDADKCKVNDYCNMGKIDFGDVAV